MKDTNTFEIDTTSFAAGSKTASSAVTSAASGNGNVATVSVAADSALDTTYYVYATLDTSKTSDEIRSAIQSGAYGDAVVSATLAAGSGITEVADLQLTQVLDQSGALIPASTVNKARCTCS